MKRFYIILSLIFLILFHFESFGIEKKPTPYIYNKQPSHLHIEESYVIPWCEKHCGIQEYENDDKTRVDCLTATHAVEFDFANKWAESIGQAEHYALMTGKKGKVVLILENPDKEMVYFNRVKCLGKIHNFDAEYVTTDILNLKQGKCKNIKCKCHKTHQ
jgi:hypothetical protein